MLQKDKLIESLRLELAEAQIKLVESENQGGGRLHEVERLLMEARMANARLMEDNESYQLLLQERTLKGDFGTSDFSYMGGSPRRGGAASSNQDALNALEGRSGSAGTDTPGAGSTSLADELSEAAETESDAAADSYRRLETELRSAKDQNKALTLYINRIIERLLQHQEFEHILDQSNDAKATPNVNKDLPAPPGPRQPQPSVLQRVKSIAVGGNKPRPRPMSVFMGSSTGTTPTPAVDNPDTAPSIPIGLTRSTSVRRNRPMSEQFTGGPINAPAAGNLVNTLYRGPMDSSTGQFSPPLRSATQSFFGSNVNPSRASSSTATTPLHPPQPASSGNFPGMKSETSSTSGDSTGDVGTPPSLSPPRSQKEKGTTFGGGAPRPLRLVQEQNANAMPQETSTANKRASWMGWAFGAKKEDAPGALGKEDVIRE